MGVEHAALVVLNVQNDFCLDGATAVRDAELILETIVRLMGQFDFVVGTMEWHPANHVSFLEQGGVWPAHCVQKTVGAELHRSVDPHTFNLMLRLGVEADQDTHSAFAATGSNSLPLHEVLWRQGIDTFYVTGLATEYGVRATVLDGLKNGYQVHVLKDAIAAINRNRGDGSRALDEMKQAGAHLIKSSDVKV